MTTPATREEVVAILARELQRADDSSTAVMEDVARDLPQDVSDWGAFLSRAALTALEQSGIVLVPVEATEEMRDAFWSVRLGGPIPMMAQASHSAMMSASPYKKEQTNG